MSQSHVRKPKQPPQPVVWWRLALGSSILLFCLRLCFSSSIGFALFLQPTKQPPERFWRSGKSLTLPRETGHGGKILYGAEAHVQYMAEGQMQNRWLRASDDLTQESLLLALAAHPTECLVYWPPHHPENAGEDSSRFRCGDNPLRLRRMSASDRQFV